MLMSLLSYRNNQNTVPSIRNTSSTISCCKERKMNQPCLQKERMNLAKQTEVAQEKNKDFWGSIMKIDNKR